MRRALVTSHRTSNSQPSHSDRQQRRAPGSASTRVCSWLLGGLLALASNACATSANIPGTEIPDTPETREVLDVLEQYRVAFIRRDAASVYALAHETYYDPMGTDDPSDDVDRKALGQLLKARLSQLHSLRFAIDYLSVDFEAADRVLVRAYIDASFRMKAMLAPNGDVREQGAPATAQDYAEYELLKGTDGLWRLIRGI